MQWLVGMCIAFFRFRSGQRYREGKTKLFDYLGQQSQNTNMPHVSHPSLWTALPGESRPQTFMLPYPMPPRPSPHLSRPFGVLWSMTREYVIFIQRTTFFICLGGTGNVKTLYCSSGHTLCSILSVRIFCNVFLKCSTGCLADTPATVQSKW